MRRLRPHDHRAQTQARSGRASAAARARRRARSRRCPRRAPRRTRGRGRRPRRATASVCGEKPYQSHTSMLALNAKPSTAATAASDPAVAEERCEQRSRGPARAPAEHLLRRPDPLAEEEVRDERRERTGRDARAQAERRTGDDRDHRHRLHARDRREQHAACGGARGERRDHRELARRGRAALEPRDARRQPARPRRATSRALRPSRRALRRAARARSATSLDTDCPPARRARPMRSATSAAHGRSCVTTSVPRSRRLGAQQRASSALRSGSTPRVGSSSTSSSGSVASTAASASRSRSPEERSRGWRSMNRDSPSCAEHRRARAPRRPPSATSSRTRSVTRWRPGSCAR